MVTDNFTFNGQDSIFYNGSTSIVQAVQNKAHAFVYGATINASAEIINHTTIAGVVTYTYGRYKEDGNEIPLDHIPPVYGRVSLKHERERWDAELFSLFNGWKRIDNYNPNGEDNQQYATPDGMPSWYTINFRTGINLGHHVYVQAAVENLLDRNYRYFASGISAPGRNFILSAKFSL